MATSQDFVNWVCSDSLDPRFLKYVLLAEHEAFARFASGTTHQTIYFPEVKAFHIALPPIQEQRKIAFVLNTLDDKVELNRRLIENLETMARALFKSWLIDFDPVRAKADLRDLGLPKGIADLFPDSFQDSELGNIPAGWHVRRVSEVVDFVRGCEPGRSSCNDEGRGLRFIRVGEVTGKRTSTLFTELGQDSRCRVGDVLVALDGTPGAVSYSLDGIYSSGIRKLVPRASHITNCYLWLLAESERFQSTVREHAQGTTIQHAGGAVEYFRDVDPGANVAAAFAGMTDSMWKRLLQLQQENDCLVAIRDTLLPKLVGGELRVCEATPISARAAG